MIHKQNHSKEEKKKGWIQSILYLQFYRHETSHILKRNNRNP